MVAESRVVGVGAVVGEFLRAAIVENKGGAGGVAANLAKEVGFCGGV